MTMKWLTGALSAGLGLSVVAAFAAGEPTLPHRKAGLWELKTSMDEGAGPREQSMKMCIDASMEANTVLASISEHKKNCEKYDIKQEAGRTVVDMVCMFNERHVASLTEMDGDFSSAFKIKITSTTTDTKVSTQQSIIVKRTILQDGKYLSENCGELKAGEAEAPDGTKLLVQ